MCVCLEGSEGLGPVCPGAGVTDLGFACTFTRECGSHGALWLLFQDSVILGPTADFPT